MKSYPSIRFVREVLGKVPGTQNWFVFDKLDGSNIRAEWTRKGGFTKFGTRNRLMDESDTQFGEAITLFREKYEEDLGIIFRHHRWQRAMAFFEFWGENSFAGTHADEEHTVTLIDVSVYKKGILMPEDFVDIFSEVDHAKLLHRGTVNMELVERVIAGEFPGVTTEGVVLKTRAPNRKPQPLMAKVKTGAWLARLREKCDGDEAMFERLR